MSIIFRLKTFLGLIPTAQKLDKDWEILCKMRDDLSQMEGSDELKKFLELKNLVDSSAFQHIKREITSLNFSGSAEEKSLNDFKTLAKSYAIKNYLKLKSSPQLGRFQKSATGCNLERYLVLQKEIESSAFQSRKLSQKKNAFIASPDYALWLEYKQLASSDEIRFWKKFKASASYQSYLKTDGSRDLLKYDELKEQTSQTEFKERVAYLKDKTRYQKSEEYKTEVAFKILDKSRFMADYRKLKQAKELDFFAKWEVVLEENFTGKELNTNLWQPENFLSHKLAGFSFSQDGEAQKFNGLKNIQVQNNLSIWSKKERVMGQTWKPSFGLVPKQFDYTSAILNSASGYRIQEGVVEAKVRFSMDPSITSAFSLTGNQLFPQIDLFRSGKNSVGVGIIEDREAKNARYLMFNGISEAEYHIFRLEIGKNELVWKINGYEIHRVNYKVSEPMFFNLLSSLHGEVNEHKLPHRFEIDWIRCFVAKN